MLLRSFALSILVPQDHYRAVSDWIDGRHLGQRVVYYQVPAAALTGRIAPPKAVRGTLAAKLDVKPDSPFAAWLERELAERAGVECVPTLAEFRRAARAITRSGQIKGGSRHEKDDRHPIGDRGQPCSTRRSRACTTISSAGRSGGRCGSSRSGSASGHWSGLSQRLSARRAERGSA